MSTDVLALLQRPDKWYLGQAPGLLFAPSAPVWLDSPGFWDVAHYLHYAVEPLFTYALVDDDGHASPLRAERRDWRPDRLQVDFSAPGMNVRETRTCGPEDVVCSVVEVTNLGTERRRLRLVAWTAQSVTDDTLLDAGETGGALHVRRVVGGLRNSSRALSLALGLAGARSLAVQLSENTANQPRFFQTPFYETLADTGLPGTVKLTGVNRTGLLYLGLERPLDLEPGETQRAVIGAAVGLTTEEAREQLGRALVCDPPAESEQAWRDFFARVPYFDCSDPYLTTYYWYRWYGLRLNTLATEIGNYRYPAVAEGPGYFRVPISYSAQCHVLETRWLASPALARGSILNFVANQREDGSLPNHIHVDFIAPEGIYHADWGQRLLDLHAVHPDLGLLERAYPALERYLHYFYDTRDPQGSGLFDHVNQWESGQEYMSRYVWVDDEGDEWKALKRRLKGLDASIYVYRLERALAEVSRVLGKGEEESWERRAERTRRAILERCWDPELQAFVDVSPELERSGLVFALSFYPFFTDLVADEHLPSIHRYLLNPDEFWTAYPVPASPKSDPYYSAVPEWKGKRTNCPWNGRTWPMTNSHVAEALVGAARLDPALRERAAEFIARFVKMLFLDGDLRRPNSYEHYNPETGAPSLYRGIDDYQHSWVVDLLIKYVAGVQPELGKLVVDPLPFGLERFVLSGARVAGRRVDVSHDPSGFAVSVDGQVVHSSAAPQRVELNLSPAGRSASG